MPAVCSPHASASAFGWGQQDPGIQQMLGLISMLRLGRKEPPLAGFKSFHGALLPSESSETFLLLFT